MRIVCGAILFNQLFQPLRFTEAKSSNGIIFPAMSHNNSHAPRARTMTKEKLRRSNALPHASVRCTGTPYNERRMSHLPIKRDALELVSIRRAVNIFAHYARYNVLQTNQPQNI